jgi:serine/threonine protein kinase
VSENYEGSGLRTEDISRISFQLFDAVSHCAKHGIIHRDIKVSTKIRHRPRPRRTSPGPRSNNIFPLRFAVIFTHVLM